MLCLVNLFIMTLISHPEEHTDICAAASAMTIAEKKVDKGGHPKIN